MLLEAEGSRWDVLKDPSKEKHKRDKSVKHVDDSELLVKDQSVFHEYHGISREYSNSGKGWATSLGGFARRNSREAPKH